MRFRSAFLFFIGLSLCLKANHSKATSCTDSQEIRLDKAGGTLAQASIQDQDGLGTCYANAASLLLQSAVPNSPDLSFLQISLNHLDSNNKSRTDGTTSYDVDGGYICKAINATVDRQNSGVGLCPRSKISIESYRNIENPLWGAMSFLQKNKKATSTSDDVARRKAMEVFSAVAERLKSEVDRGSVEKCRPPHYDLDYTKLNTVNIIEDIIMAGLEDDQSCVVRELPSQDSDYCMGLSKLYASSSYSKADRFRTFQSVGLKWEYRDRILNKIKKQKDKLRSPEDLMRLIESELHQIAFSKPKHKSRLSQVTSQARPRYLAFLEEDFQLLKGQADESCRIKYAIEVMTTKPEVLLKTECADCSIQGLDQSVKSLGRVIGDLQVKNLSQIYDFIKSNTNQNIDAQVMGLLGANCSPKDWVKIPEKTRCQENVPNFTPQEFRQETANYKKFVEQTRDRAIKSLQQGKAIGYSLCTRFLKDDKFTYHAVEPQSDAVNKCREDRHGFHAVAMIGYRCTNGKAQYLVQNSWGSKWQPDRKDLNAENGKIWLDEKDFFGNGTDFGFIDRE